MSGIIKKGTQIVHEILAEISEGAPILESAMIDHEEHALYFFQETNGVTACMVTGFPLKGTAKQEPYKHNEPWDISQRVPLEDLDSWMKERPSRPDHPLRQTMPGWLEPGSEIPPEIRSFFYRVSPDFDQGMAVREDTLLAVKGLRYPYGYSPHEYSWGLVPRAPITQIIQEHEDRFLTSLDARMRITLSTPLLWVDLPIAVGQDHQGQYFIDAGLAISTAWRRTLRLEPHRPMIHFTHPPEYGKKELSFEERMKDIVKISTATRLLSEALYDHRADLECLADAYINRSREIERPKNNEGRISRIVPLSDL